MRQSPQIGYHLRVTLNEIEPPKEFDDYVLGRELGRGVAGRVYVAEDTMLARPVAIKFIANLDAGARQQFLLEARAVAKLQHPNVVSIYRVATLQNRPYLVTELVRGASLAELDKPVPGDVALDIAIGVARGLAAVHRVNVVHCDLKPSNVVIDHEGVAKIIDFGLARPISERGTAGHTPVGTPDYMAPEVWQGEPPSRRSDVYGVGAVVFELIAGTPPFGKIRAEDLRARVISEDAPVLRDVVPQVDPELSAVVARCLSRDRAARFADGGELRQALERLHASRRPSAQIGESPYRGLLPFEASHRGLFFGRRSEVDAVVERLRSEPIVLVTGDSGVGKSSLCRAGVVPAVVDGELGGAWETLTIIPGHLPLTALATALGDLALVSLLRETPALLARELRRHAGERGLIVLIDQLEELITLGDPGEVAALDAGLATLAEGVPGLRLLATVRADFLARISTLPSLGRDLSRTLYFLRPLPKERLRDVIVGPAEAVGGRFESEKIVDELVESAAQAGSGGLPLLSFALSDLWEARDRADDVIRRSAVDAMGGVPGALSRHADVVLAGLLVDERRQAARRVLLRLVTSMSTRARRSAQELALGDAARAALDALVRGRLVVVHDGEGEPEYELAHECLINGWTTLRKWLEDDVAGRLSRERLTVAAAEWMRHGRHADATWQGPQLAEAVKLDAASLSANDRAFVAASVRAHRRRRWQRRLAAFAALVLVIFAFLGQRYLARHQLAAAVAVELHLARDTLADAQRADRERARLAAQAYAAYDALYWDGLGKPLWAQAIAARDAALRGYRNASRHVEIAFAKDPTRADVRDLIGDILLARATLAEQIYDTDDRDQLIEQMAFYDADGRRRAQWATQGMVFVRAPADALITLDSGLKLGTGSAEVALDAGSYVLVITAPDRVVVRAPIIVDRGGTHTVNVNPPHRGDVPAGMIYVPAGEFLFGNADDEDRENLFMTTPLYRRSTGEFLIGRNEVTFADWFAFVEAQPREAQAALLPTLKDRLSGGVEASPDGKGHWQFELQVGKSHYKVGWNERIRYLGRTSHIEQDWRRFPVLGVSAGDAVAYAAWLDRSGRLPGARLCSEREWERAARGADARPYPAIGRSIDPDAANFDQSHPGYAGPDEVGLHPASRSPFGLNDTFGNAFEWTISEALQKTDEELRKEAEEMRRNQPSGLPHEEPATEKRTSDSGPTFLIRGGSYQHDRKSGNLSNRAPMTGSERDPVLGLRVCATPPLPR